MNRKKIIELFAICGGSFVSFYIPAEGDGHINKKDGGSADVVIAGGGLGGCAAALAALRNNKKVIPRVVRERKELLEEFQNLIHAQGIETHWPKK
jgi:hypothetical protein